MLEFVLAVKKVVISPSTGTDTSAILVVVVVTTVVVVILKKKIRVADANGAAQESDLKLQGAKVRLSIVANCQSDCKYLCQKLSNILS